MRRNFYRLLAPSLVVLVVALFAALGRDSEPPEKLGSLITVRESTHGLPPHQYTWKLVDGKVYKGPENPLSSEEVAQIRQVILLTEHEDALEGYNLKVDVLVADGGETSDPGSQFSLSIDLGGEPHIKLSCKNVEILTAFAEPTLEMIPNWHIEVGSRSWNTRNRKVAQSVTKLCEYPGVPKIALDCLDRYFSNLESPLREAIREWAGFPELNRKLKLIETRESPTTIHFEFKVRDPNIFSHVSWSIESPANDDNLSHFVPAEVASRYIALAKRHGYYFDPVGGLEPDWGALLTELEMAERIVSGFDWVGRLKEEGIIERVHLQNIRGLAMEDWPLKVDPDIQIEVFGRGWSDELLLSAERQLAFASSLGPDLCTALAVPGYQGRKPIFTPEGLPIVPVDDNAATVLIETDGTATLLRQW